MATLSTAVGAQILMYALNLSGYAQGTNGALANGSGSGMGTVKGIENINAPVAKSRAVAIPGDNALIGTIILPPNTASTGDLTTTVNDPVFSTSPVGGLVNTENGKDYELIGLACPTFKSMTLINNTPAQNATSGNLGNPGWSVSVYPNMFLFPRSNDNAQDGQPQKYMFDLVMSMFDRYPWGEQPTVVLNGSTRALRLNPFFSLVPWTIHSYVAAATSAGATNITINETPYALTAAYIEVWKNGTLLTITTDWTITGKIINIVGTTAAADKFEVWYGFVPTC